MSDRPSDPRSWPLPDPGPNRTGGWLWHARAIRSRGRWRPTLDAIEAWLSGAGFQSDELVLIGASAGWMMPHAFLAGFRSVAAFDIDPLARPLFAIRHGAALRKAGVEVNWYAWDALARLEEVLDRWPRAALLFDNVLGQQIYRCSELEALEHALVGLAGRLRGREWASIHDWLSGAAHPNNAAGLLTQPADRVQRVEGGLRLGATTVRHDDLLQTLVARLGGSGEWQDHRTGEIFPIGTEVSVIAWEFLPGKWHWLQAGRVAGAA